MDLERIDAAISLIEKELDFYSYLRPLNGVEEKNKFFDSLSRGKAYNPVFSYKRSDTVKLRAELRRTARFLERAGLIGTLLRKKRDLLSGEMDLLDGGDGSLMGISSSLYGVPDVECLAFSREVLSGSLEEKYVFPEETVKPGEMASVMRAELDKRNTGWRCVLSHKIIPKITVSSRDRTIYVNAGINYTSEEISRLKRHEIEVHVYRGINGGRQPFKIFAEGLAGYDETEEGLAIEIEKLSGCLDTDTRQMKLYAGRALCADLSMKTGFYEVFSEMREYFPADIAYRITERAKRGLRDTSRKGAINKAFHYISGWLKVRKYAEKGGDLAVLFVGKIGLDDIAHVKALLSEGVLSPPAYLPEVLK